MMIGWYSAVVRPKVLYAAGTWYRRLNSHGRRKLESIQRRFLVKALRCYRTVSNDALSVLAGVPPINIFAQHLCRKFDLMSNGSSILVGGRYLRREDYEIKRGRMSRSPMSYLENLRLGTGDCLPEVPGGLVVFYTDGSKMNGGVGLGALKLDTADLVGFTMETLRPENSVFQAEASALEDPVVEHYGAVQIMTDSLSTIKALSNNCPKSPIIGQILDRVGAMDVPVIISWIKAHDGYLGNEAADMLAKMAAGGDRPTVIVPFPLSHFRANNMNRMMEEWQYHWGISDKGRSTYEILPEVRFTPQINNLVLRYFVTGHGSFPSFLKKIGKMDTDRCECGLEGTPLHYLQVSCGFSRDAIKPRANEELGAYFRRLDRNATYLRVLTGIYNKLNKHYSFVVTLL